MNTFKSKEGRTAVLEYYGRLLNQAAITYETINLTVSCGSTYVLAAGDHDNPPLVLLHGSSMNSIMWIRDMETFSRHYRVYAPDLPGEPGHSSEEQLPLDQMDYVIWLKEVFNSLGLDKANLAGISLGGWLAARFAICCPEQVLKLVLLCPAGIGGQNHAFKEIALSLLPKGESGIDELFRMINGNKPIPELMLNYQKLIAAVTNARMETVPLMTDEELMRLTIPSLLIVGELDIMLNSGETASRYRFALPDASVIILPDAGHSLTGLADTITGFLLSG